MLVKVVCEPQQWTQNACVQVLLHNLVLSGLLIAHHLLSENLTPSETFGPKRQLIVRGCKMTTDVYPEDAALRFNQLWVSIGPRKLPAPPSDESSSMLNFRLGISRVN